MPVSRDSYLKKRDATVTGFTDTGGIVLDRTVFYAASGGQGADRGALHTSTGDIILIENAGYMIGEDPRLPICPHRAAE